jgi:serine/threonine protein kinase
MENILFDTNFDIKVGDFGFTTAVEGKDKSGMMKSQKGTVRYMAPEIL